MHLDTFSHIVVLLELSPFSCFLFSVFLFLLSVSFASFFSRLCLSSAPLSFCSLTETEDPNAVLCLYKTENECVMKFMYSEHANGMSVLTALKEPGQYWSKTILCCRKHGHKPSANCFSSYIHFHRNGGRKHQAMCC